MWTTIISTICTLSISIIPALLPFIVKMITYFIDKSNADKELKADVLKYLENIQKDLPINLHDKYETQLARIRKQIEDEKNRDNKLS